MNKQIKSVIITLFFTLVYYYVMLPPINLTSPYFYFSLYVILILYILVSGVLNIKNIGSFNKDGIFIKNRSYNKTKNLKIVLGMLSLIIITILAVNLYYSPIFNSSIYSKRINVIENANFTEDVKPVDFDKLTLLDKDSSRKLGDRVMGQMPDLVSQFDVSDIYTQINYEKEIERVTPLEYADIFKYLSNRKEGITGYIKVNSVTGESSLIRLNKGMKYMESALFNDNLHRKLRFSYPFDIFGEATFEIDENENPHWIIPVTKYKGVGNLKEVSHIIIFNPVDGSSTKYKVKDAPSWVDHVYEADLVIDQLNDWGKYKGGFFNSLFRQKGVVATTEGYNYIVMNDDVYLTTGITSVVRDESNVGFVLVNLRTKETKLYDVPGAEEYSAMASAEGQVQQMKYTATFPILINLNNKPTYIISLKDNAGLVKMYAFVDLVDYQKVVVTDSSKGIKKAAKNYLANEVNTVDIQKEATIEIKSINNINIDGNTYIYITDKDNNKYKASIRVDEEKLPFIKVNDKLKIKYIENTLNEIISIEK